MRNFSFLLLALLAALLLAAGCTGVASPLGADIPAQIPDDDVPDTGYYLVVSSSGKMSATIYTPLESRELIEKNTVIITPITHRSGKIEIAAGTDHAPIYAAIYKDGRRLAAGYSEEGSLALSIYT